ncbi:glucose-6-phosphate isomerase [Aliiroseovarius halocynthiae]|uniref:Glucose-6-phosphate isomerase n=1 Tax=Aliiroseovarius halocynthiae TaxID=985055 RepID=A0A545SVM6_9RHOB|nr:glucose-6-phosphate isomerase [Aliiroseovarius halocynthiae]TQV69018.1 glucose-6-phosphate isomerase [Aliiroseovarius halocynthiae]SMR71768.1 glucose-6-phosphate isomerase [Aliiroseovarius halocynthiae]
MTINDLIAHRGKLKDVRLQDLFDADPKRADRYSSQMGNLHFDWSKTGLDDQAVELLQGFADKAGVAARRDQMFQGDKINLTEDRAVLHTALRAASDADVRVGGDNVIPEVHETLARMRDFATRLRSGQIRAPGGGRFRDVVNIGIGGSDLGPAMATQALSPYHDGPRVHFVSNVDGAQIADVLRKLDPAETLIMVASKTFTTIETMTNAATARDWLARDVPAESVGLHFAALSSNLEKTAEWGIADERVFGFEDWVGGRYSMWGPIGLSLMVAIGPDRFDQMLAGARAMDQHFQSAEGRANMPLMLALVGFWHRQVCGYPTRAVLPYEQRLARLPAYLQQLEMESNGKRVGLDGTALDLPSGPVVWGEPGTNGQHAFYQLIHQGTDIIPCEFMVGAEGHEADLAHQHQLLVANCLAQSQALMAGRSLEKARALMHEKGFEGDELERQAAHRVFPGNRPSTTLLYPKLTPEVLGAIVALYEHRVFVEGVLLGINSFDQWGVELGKELAVALTPVLQGETSAENLDGSTQALIKRLDQMSTVSD